VLLKQFSTLEDLWHGTCRALLYCPKDKLSWQAGATTGIYDNLLVCNSMEYHFDCADIWLTAGRFKKLQRDYLNYELLPLFIDKAASMKQNLARRGTVTQMSCRVHGEVVNMGGRKKNNYKWGNCIFGFSFRPSDKQAGVFTMHSRTSYISYMGGMDLALAWVIAREIAKSRGDSIEDYGFRWMIDSLQWYSIKSLAYLSTYGPQPSLLDGKKSRSRYPDNDFPSAKITRNSFNFMERRREADYDPKYGPTLRMYQMLYNPDRRPASSPVSSLSLEALAA